MLWMSWVLGQIQLLFDFFHEFLISLDLSFLIKQEIQLDDSQDLP